MNRRTVMIGTGLLISLGGVNALVIQKERLLASGRKVLLELAPVDPRSLIQGDYMTLDYDAARRLRSVEDAPSDGNVVIKLDARGVGTFVRVEKGNETLSPDELRLRYRTREGTIRIGSGAFFFQEGHAGHYERAKYGELRVADSGTSVLVALCDKDVVRIKPM